MRTKRVMRVCPKGASVPVPLWEKTNSVGSGGKLIIRGVDVVEDPHILFVHLFFPFPYGISYLYYTIPEKTFQSDSASGKNFFHW